MFQRWPAVALPSDHHVAEAVGAVAGVAQGSLVEERELEEPSIRPGEGSIGIEYEPLSRGSVLRVALDAALREEGP